MKNVNVSNSRWTVIIRQNYVALSNQTLGQSEFDTSEHITQQCPKMHHRVIGNSKEINYK